MRALRNEGEGRVVMADMPDPEPGPGDALIRIEASAICGSERHALTEVRDWPEGLVSNGGHEACGTVVEPGSSRFSVGDRVGLSAVVGCGACDWCTAGQEIFCRKGPRGSSKSGGWHAELAVIDAAGLRELPPQADAKTGVLVSGDSLGVPGRAQHRVPSTSGDRVLVIGLGPVGLSHVIVRRFVGAEVVAVEPSAYRRALAAEAGATVYDSLDDVADFKPRLVIECSGRPDCIERAFELVDDAGTVLQSGECFEKVGINPSDTFIRHEINYTGTWYYTTDDYPMMLELATSGLQLDSLCTHDVAAADAQPAVDDFMAGESGKVVLRWT